MTKHLTPIRGICIAALCLLAALSAARHGTHFPDLNAYTQTTAMVLTLAALLMMAAHTLLNFNKHMILQTARAAGIILLSLAITTGITWSCGHFLRYAAALAGTLRESHTAIMAGTALMTLSLTVLTARVTVRRTRITLRDLNRAFAYLHGLLAAALTVALPDASCLFTVSALMFMAIQLVITFRRDALDWGLELLATGLYLPILVPAAAALEPGIVWAFGPLLALGVFPVGVWLAE